MCSPRRRASLIAAFLIALCLPPVAVAEIPIGGQVTAGGEPAPEARVALLPVAGRYERGRLHLTGVQDPEPIAQTHPNADGRFHLEAPGIGLYEVKVSLDGRVPQAVALLPLLYPIELPAVDLEHDAGLEVSLTAEGEPVKGRVAAFPTDPAIIRIAGRPWPPSRE